MQIVTISRGSYHHGKAVAEKLAAKLGYTCLSRDEIIADLDEFHLPEIKLVRCLTDTFSVLERFPHGKQRFVTAIRAALLERFIQGKIVYHGLVGQYFLRNISHVLKIRIIADTERRIAYEMARENIPADQARFILKKDDEERRKWAMFLYGIDILSADNYNMIIRIGHMGEDDAVDILASAVQLPAFQVTPESQALLEDEALAARVRHKLIDYPHASVAAHRGHLVLTLKVPEGQRSRIEERIAEMLSTTKGVTGYSLQFESYF
ncbi:MAG: cytidylate kinase-like family protein [Desulfopila sp.]|jgi:cytidylate kinase|nr:cytidylate kinase-like family protein [Desulfopila sp.]